MQQTGRRENMKSCDRNLGVWARAQWGQIIYFWWVVFFEGEWEEESG